MDRNERIQQAELIWQNYSENRNKNTIELRRLLLDIDSDLSQEEKNLVYKIKSIDLKNESLTIDDMHDILELIKNLDSIKNREDNNSIYRTNSISKNKYGPNNPYPSK
ncbi:MAG: hypothetical protein IKV26_07395 [Paludibacteraceae bacterium]|nr:hypothetical protein [Paludibacteraceae bacterium]